jgi:SNF2 family DNA or RNA helicase
MSLRPLISRANKCLLLPFEGKVAALWPQAACIQHNGTKLAIIPHTPREQIALEGIGIPVPPPILEYYDWEKTDPPPFQIQKITAALMTSSRRCYVLNDMGTGKTRAALWAWRYLNRQKCAGKLLVVAPLSTLKFTWLAECRKVIPDCKAIVLHSSTAKRRKQLLEEDADVFIINHDGLKTIVSELWNRKDIDMMVLDELAVYRNNSQRSKTMREFAKRFTWVVGMTGRPCPNAPTDVWGQCKIVTPGTVPKFFSHARTQLMTRLDQYNWAPKPEAINTAISWMRPAVRYSLDDVVELPEAIYRTIDVELTEQQLFVYRRVAEQYAAMVQDKQITAANAAVAMGKLLQIGAGYVYTATQSDDDKKEYVTLDSAPRQQALLDIIESAPHKVLIACPWTHLITRLSELLTDNKIEHAVVFGETRKREQIFNDFQNSDRYVVLLTHPRTTHHGITLTAATTAVWYSPSPSLEVYEQFNARIRRVGQRHKQEFLHLQATSVERRVYGLLRSKQRLQDAFLQMIKETQEPSNDYSI